MEWEWTIEATNCHINFKSIGYMKYIRKGQIYKKSQQLDLKEH